MCKRLIYLTCFVLVLVVLPPVTHAQVENLLQNPSFEEDEDIFDDPTWEQWCTWNDPAGAGSKSIQSLLTAAKASGSMPKDLRTGISSW